MTLVYPVELEIANVRDYIRQRLGAIVATVLEGDVDDVQKECASFVDEVSELLRWALDKGSTLYLIGPSRPDLN